MESEFPVDQFAMRVVDMVNKHGREWKFIGEQLGEHPEKVRSAYRRYKGTHTPDNSPSEQGGVEDEGAVVDLIQRAIGKELPAGQLSRMKFWEVPYKDEATGEMESSLLYSTQFDVSLKVDPQEIAQDTLEAIKKHAPSYDGITHAPPVGQNMYEVCIFDLHFGKYAASEETRGPNYDMDIAEDLFGKAVDHLLSKVTAPVDYILMCIGQDLFNSDVDNYTTKGTPQDNHGTHREHFRRVRHMMVSAIDKALNIAPVDIVCVSGNHDMNSVYYLGEVMDAWYSKTPHVTVDNSPALRKYHKYGKNLIGFSHGNEEKDSSLPQIMANEARREWGDTLYAEWHLGHEHKSSATKYTPITTIDGVILRRIASLSPPDWWHGKKGYTSGPLVAEAFLWNALGGIDDTYKYTYRGE